MNYWLIKSEPHKYSWDKFNKDGKTFWDGVRNYQARNNLREMKENLHEKLTPDQFVQEYGIFIHCPGDQAADAYCTKTKVRRQV